MRKARARASIVPVRRGAPFSLVLDAGMALPGLPSTPGMVGADSQTLIDQIASSFTPALRPAFGIPYNPEALSGMVDDTAIQDYAVPLQGNAATGREGTGVPSLPVAPRGAVDPYAAITFPAPPTMRPIPRYQNTAQAQGGKFNPLVAGIAALFGGGNAALPAMVAYGRGLSQQDAQNYQMQRQGSMDRNMLDRQGWQDQSGVALHQLQLLNAQESAKARAARDQFNEEYRRAMLGDRRVRTNQAQDRLEGVTIPQEQRRTQNDATRFIASQLLPGMQTGDQARIVMQANRLYGTDIPVPGTPVAGAPGKYHPRLNPSLQGVNTESMLGTREHTMQHQDKVLDLGWARLALAKQMAAWRQSKGTDRSISPLAMARYAGSMANQAQDVVDRAKNRLARAGFLVLEPQRAKMQAEIDKAEKDLKWFMQERNKWNMAAGYSDFYGQGDTNNLSDFGDGTGEEDLIGEDADAGLPPVMMPSPMPSPMAPPVVPTPSPGRVQVAPGGVMPQSVAVPARPAHSAPPKRRPQARPKPTPKPSYKEVSTKALSVLERISKKLGQ